MTLDRRIAEFKKIFSQALEKPLPGASCQFKLSPPFRDQTPAGKNKKNAAVLILIYPKADTLFTVFTKRNDYNGPHSGQISFPGGKFDNSDDSLEKTAIRETNEEIGTSLTTKDIVGRLTSLYIPVSNFEVSPFVATVPDEPVFNIDVHEVQYTIEIPLYKILQNSKIKSMDVIIESSIVAVPCFNFNNNQIWGATAMMLNEFIEVLKGENQDFNFLR